MEERRKARITLIGEGGATQGKSKDEELNEIREKLSLRGKAKVSLET